MSARLHRSRAGALLRSLLDDAVFTSDELAKELVVGPHVFARFVAGAEPIPLDRQMYLAVLAVRHGPKHARRGRRLWGQVMAALEYEDGVTRRHSSLPPEVHRTLWSSGFIVGDG